MFLLNASVSNEWVALKRFVKPFIIFDHNTAVWAKEKVPEYFIKMLHNELIPQSRFSTVKDKHCEPVNASVSAEWVCVPQSRRIQRGPRFTTVMVSYWSRCSLCRMRHCEGLHIQVSIAFSKTDQTEQMRYSVRSLVSVSKQLRITVESDKMHLCLPHGDANQWKWGFWKIATDGNRSELQSTAIRACGGPLGDTHTVSSHILFFFVPANKSNTIKSATSLLGDDCSFICV